MQFDAVLGKARVFIVFILFKCLSDRIESILKLPGMNVSGIGIFAYQHSYKNFCFSSGKLKFFQDMFRSGEMKFNLRGVQRVKYSIEKTQKNACDPFLAIYFFQYFFFCFFSFVRFTKIIPLIEPALIPPRSSVS